VIKNNINRSILNNKNREIIEKYIKLNIIKKFEVTDFYDEVKL
jgi:hypothetical protein